MQPPFPPLFSFPRATTWWRSRRKIKTIALGLLVGLSTILTTTAHASDDPTRTTVHATLVTEDGEPVRLFFPKDASNLNCPVDVDSTRAYDIQAIADNWCRASVTLLYENWSTTITSKLGTFLKVVPTEPGKRPSRQAFSVEEINTALERASETSNTLTFTVAPGPGTVVVRTSPVGNTVYYGEIEAGKLTPGEEAHLTLTMQPAATLEVITPVKTLEPKHMVVFGKKHVIFTNHQRSGRQKMLERGVSLPMDRDSTAYKELLGRYGDPLAGTWILNPGEYDVDWNLVPENHVAMVSQGGTVTRLEQGQKVKLENGVRTVLSVSPAISK